MEKTKRTGKHKIRGNRKIAADHFVMEISSGWIAAHSRPGQFVAVSVRDGRTDPLLRIPLGIHAINRTGISLLYKVVGEGTRILSGKRKGEEIDILGPLGNGFDTGMIKKGDAALVVAGGHGVAPLFALTGHLIKKGAAVEFFTGACKAEHIVREKDLRKLGANVHVATDDGSKGKKGYVTELVNDFLRRGTRDEGRITIYACGPRPMLAAVSRAAKKHKIAAQVSVDAYMACGIGACLGCAIKTTGGYKLVCKDGPVFNAGEIVWEEACAPGA